MKISTIPTTKASLITAINESFEIVANQINSTDDTHFNTPDGKKWSIAQHVDHLIKSSFPVANALKTSKLLLRAMGKPAYPAVTYEGLYDKYMELLQTGVKTTTKFDASTEPLDKATLLSNWKMIQGKLATRIEEKWSEKDLDKYVIPHPYLGKFSVRQMMYFTTFHTLHHAKAIAELS